MRILVAEDDPDSRAILTDYLTYTGHTVITAANGEEALQLAHSRPLNAALLDNLMPGISGLDLIFPLRQLHPGLVIIIITAYADIPQAVTATHAGADNYLPKPISPRALRDVLERTWTARQNTVGILQSLTPRERDVLLRLAAGKTDAQIAAELCITTRTASAHVNHILDKLQAENRVQAAALWLRAQKIDISANDTPAQTCYTRQEAFIV